MTEDSGTGRTQHGRFSRLVLTLNGIDSSTVRSTSEVILPAILLAFVAANAIVAALFFGLASKVFFNDLEGYEQIIAGLVIGLIVGMVDWLIISWHPSLPGWYVSGSRVVPVRLLAAKSVSVAAVMGLLVWLATMSIEPQWEWFQRATLAGLAAFVSGLGTAVLLQWRFGGEVLSDGIYPSMPSGVEKIPSFLIRLLLTLTLAAVVGFGISVVANAAAVEQGRLLVAQDAAVQRLQEDEDAKYHDEMDRYDQEVARVKKANEERVAEIERLTGQVGSQREEVADAEATYKEALAETRCQKSASCSGFAGGRGLDRAISAEEKALEARGAAIAALGTLNDQLIAAQKRSLEEQPEVPVRTIVTKEDVGPEDVDVEAVQGIAATADSLHRAAEEQDWPWWALWGPEIFVLVLDMIPVLLKLISGYQPAEQLTWRRTCRELETESLKELEGQGAGRAAITLAAIQSAGNQDVAKAKWAALLDAAAVEGRAFMDVAEVQRAAQVSVAKIDSQSLVEEARIRATARLNAAQAATTEPTGVREGAVDAEASSDTATQSVKVQDGRQQGTASRGGVGGGGHGSRSERSSFNQNGATPDLPTNRSTRGATASGTGHDPVWAEDGHVDGEIFDVGAQSFLLGPTLSRQASERRQVVRLAVQLAGSPGREMIKPEQVRDKCVVVKLRGAEMSAESWARVVAPHRRDVFGDFSIRSRIVDGAQEEIIVDKRYVPRMDLERYVGFLKRKGMHIPYRQVATWAQDVVRYIEQLHDSEAAHCDLKPANILVKGDMEIGRNELRGSGKDLGFLRVTDFDTLAAFGQRTTGTPGWAAPEFIDPDDPAHQKASAAADLFGVGGILFFLLTGERPNTLVYKVGGGDIGYFVATKWIPGWQRLYATHSPTVLRGTLSRRGIPAPLENLVLRCLAPRPQDRPTAAEVREDLSEMMPGLRGKFLASSAEDQPDLLGYGPEVVKTLQRAGYMIEGVPA